MRIGSERQRGALARAVAFPSTLLLLDEPFLSLDVDTKRRCAAFILKQQRESPRTVLFATHDMTEAIDLSDHIIVHSRCPMRQRAHFAVTERDKESSSHLEEQILRVLLAH